MRHGESFAGAGNAQKGLIRLSCTYALQQLTDRTWLVTGRFKITFQLELTNSSSHEFLQRPRVQGTSAHKVDTILLRMPDKHRPGCAISHCAIFLKTPKLESLN